MMEATTIGEGVYSRSDRAKRYEKYSDADLMLMAQSASGDPAPMYEVFERQRHVFLLCALRHNVMEHADDIISDFFLKFVETPPRFDAEKGQVASYLYTSCARACVDYIRRRDREILIGDLGSDEEGMPYEFRELTSTQPKALEGLLSKAVRKDFRKCLEAMVLEKRNFGRLKAGPDALSSLTTKIAKLMLEAFDSLVERKAPKYQWPELKVLLEMYRTITSEGANIPRMHRILEAIKATIRACMKDKGYT